MSVQPQAPAVTDEVGDALKALIAASRRLRGRETHTPGQLSHAQYGLLFSLADASELSASELARNAALTPATVTQMLDAMEAHGLVTRRRAVDDRRVVRTALTARGMQVVAERRARIEPLWRATLAEFDEDELRAAAVVMERIAKFLDGLHEAA